MCDFKNGFILCTCVGEEPLEILEEKKEIPVKKKRKRHKNRIETEKSEPEVIDSRNYIWELRTLKKTEFAVGRAAFPSEDIGHGLESVWVELNLNDRNCFDFEYTPNEGDELVFFNLINKYKYLSFIYKKGVWVNDFYDEIGYITKIEKSGKVKSLKNK